MNDTIREKLKLLPDLPGSYQMKDKDGIVIYVGKAKNLKNRVKSYFHGAHNAKTTRLVSEIDDFTYIITKSELEAFLLEINLIKEYDPKYNIMLTDDKTYPYIALTNELHPRLIVTRNHKKKGYARYFGPYPNVRAARDTVALLNRIYPLRKCYNIPKKECLYYHMHQCFGPCINKEVFDYANIKKNISSFLNGDVKEIIESIEKDMLKYSDNLEFERAIECRNLIDSINKTIAKQKISINDLTSRDYIGIYVLDDEISINIIVTRTGNIILNHQTIIDNYDSITDSVESYLIQYYEINAKPKEISIIGIESNMLEKVLDVTIVDAKIGKKKEILDMALTNAKENITKRRNLYRNQVLKKLDSIEELGKMLGIKTPYRIESFDNSNLFGEYPVSAMVVYMNGKKDKKEFRKYHVKSVVGANDYATMKEVIYRRYTRLLLEGSKMPDLIIMDGGEIQVNACLETLQSLNLEIPVMGVQKDEHHNADLIYYDNKLIEISKNSAVYLLLRDISQTVHDFAISFFRSTKAKGFFSSILDNIDGLGPKRREVLLKHFVTIENIKKATVSELQIEGISKTVAENIYNYFHSDENM